MKDEELNKIISDIARKELHLETLETRNSDQLDFHDLSAESVKRALIAAFEAGRIQGEKENRWKYRYT